MPDPRIEKMTGKSGYIHEVVDGGILKIPFFAWSGVSTRTFEDRTSSVNYSKSADLVFRSSVPTAMKFEAEVMGRYRRFTTPQRLIARLFKGDELFQVQFGFTPIDPYVDMFAWIERFEVRNPLMEIVDFVCTIRSEGEITDLTNLNAPQLGDGEDPWANLGDPNQDPDAIL